MAYSEKLADRIREAFSGIKELEEKKMFRGICFMVKGKMCVCVSDDEMMCRVGPGKMEEVLEKEGVRPMIHRGKQMTGFVFVAPEAIKTKKDFDFWISLSLAFNKMAKASKKNGK
jgi:TfoX/Sxy family transcriptional regulator of competence genes